MVGRDKPAAEDSRPPHLGSNALEGACPHAPKILLSTRQRALCSGGMRLYASAMTTRGADAGVDVEVARKVGRAMSAGVILLDVVIDDEDRGLG